MEAYLKQLEADHPCPPELEWAKHFLYKPIVLLSGLTKKYLTNGGEKETMFTGRKGKDPKNQWVVYPLANGKVCIKSVMDGMNLSMHVADEIGWGFVSSEPKLVETPMQQFTMT